MGQHPVSALADALDFTLYGIRECFCFTFLDSRWSPIIPKQEVGEREDWKGCRNEGDPTQPPAWASGISMNLM